jgi:hypothetical protein
MCQRVSHQGKSPQNQDRSEQSAADAQEQGGCQSTLHELKAEWIEEDGLEHH